MHADTTRVDTTTGLAAAQAAPAAGVSDAYRRYVLFMMTLVATLNFVDRQLMSILMEPIKAEFGLSDTQLGFLTGFAFAIFYAIMGFFLAKIADTGNRRTLIASVIVLWSIMTALCGAAVGFVTLLLARIGVGIGESGSAPAIQSMLADYYPPNRRASAISMQTIGVYAGILLGFLFGGWISEAFGWRTAFVVIGLPGVLIAIWFWLTVKEPVRGQIENVVDSGRTPTFGETLRYLWSSPSFRFVPFAAGLYAFAAQGSMAWAPSFFIRSHGMTTGEIGTWLALSAGLAGGLGCFLGGIVTDRVVNRTGDERWYFWLPAGCLLLSVPALFVIYLSPTPLPALLMCAAAWFLGNTWLGPVQATLQGLADLRMRAMALAVLLFVNNLIGLGLGPQIVGFLSDTLRADFGVDSLRYALVGALSIASLLSALLFFAATRTLREDLRRTRENQR
jgi:predicted MFS family arabinose efflux permease